MFKRLNMFDVSGVFVMFWLNQFRKHQKACIIIFNSLNQFFIIFQIFSFLLPVYVNCFNLNISIDDLHLVFSDLHIIFFSHQNQIESSLCQYFTILFISLTISNQGPRVMTIFIMELFRRRDFFRSL